MVAYIAYGATMLSVIILRWKKPEAERPSRWKKHLKFQLNVKVFSVIEVDMFLKESLLDIFFRTNIGFILLIPIHNKAFVRC